MSEMRPYPPETVDPNDDNGTMPDNVAELEAAVIGRKIVQVVDHEGRMTLTLNDGREVDLVNSADCCAYTELEAFLVHPERVDHIITGVGTTDEFTTWHIYADLGDILELTVGWSCGNPFWYGYGFDIEVRDPESS